MHHKEITSIIYREFSAPPTNIRRMSNGICNEVYAVDVSGREVIVRLKREARYMLGSHNHIPIFQSLGIRVPEILAEDYSSNFVPLAYQVLSKVEGRDVNEVVDSLNDDELKLIAKEIAGVFVKLREVPNNGKY